MGIVELMGVDQINIEKIPELLIMIQTCEVKISNFIRTEPLKTRNGEMVGHG